MILDPKELSANHFQLTEIITDKLLADYKYRIYKTYRDDLLGEAMIALVKASKRYDPEKGSSFATYASFLIRGSILNFISRKLNHIVTTECDIDCMPEIESLYTDLKDEEILEEERKEENKIDIKKYEPKTEQQKKVYYRVIVNGESPSIVARELGIGRENLNRSKKNILNKIRKEIEKNGKV